jgi:hypothetical protein
MAWYLAGSTAAGAGLGALLGWVGSLVVPSAAAGPSLWVLAGLLGAGVLLDVGAGGLRLPTVRRQVNEDWLHRYRGWVYGLGFGAQLGVGFFTVVSVSAVYLAFSAAFLASSAVAGALVGGAFGLFRAGAQFAVVRVDRVDRLASVASLLRRWDRPTRLMAIGAETTMLAAILVAAVR